VGRDKHRPAPDAVEQGTGGQAEQQVGQPAQGAEQTHLAGGRAEPDRGERQRQAGDLDAQLRDRQAGPQLQEVGLGQETGALPQ
jgi:hypothetical protein